MPNVLLCKFLKECNYLANIYGFVISKSDLTYPLYILNINKKTPPFLAGLMYLLAILIFQEWFTLQKLQNLKVLWENQYYTEPSLFISIIHLLQEKSNMPHNSICCIHLHLLYNIVYTFLHIYLLISIMYFTIWIYFFSLPIYAISLHTSSLSAKRKTRK